MRLIDNLAFENTTVSSSSQNSQSRLSNSPALMKTDKPPRTYPPAVIPDYDQQFIDYSDQQEEVKYSRSAEYNALDANDMYSYNVPMIGSGSKTQSFPSHTLPRKRNEQVKAGSAMKSNNLLNLVKNNIGGMQCLPPYMGNRSAPYHMVANTPTFVQKNVQNSMVMTTGLPNTHVQIETKVPPLVPNHFNLANGNFTPGTTVVTQNSQYIYQEMVQNIDPKSFIPSMPAVFPGHENITNVAHAQTSAECTRMYQNVMLVDPFGNSSCMYPPQPMLSKATCVPPLVSESTSRAVNTLVQKPAPMKRNPNKTLIIEVGPILPTSKVSSRSCGTNTVLSQIRAPVPNTPIICTPKPEAPSISITEKVEKTEVPGTTKGLKILSNIKVEVPVQHMKSMINTVMDLTGSDDAVFPDRARTPEKILPDYDVCKKRVLHDFAQPSTAGGDGSHSFELKKFASATSNKDLNSKTSSVDNKLETDFGDSCPVPDLICNEKPSISPCSELSESGDNSVERMVPSPKPQPHTSGVIMRREDVQSKKKAPMKIRLNNIFVRKNKKILQIKNAKAVNLCEVAPMPCSSKSVAPENFAAAKIVLSPKQTEKATLKTISIEEIRQKDEDNFEVIDPVEEVDMLPAPAKSEAINVKEELSCSNECAFSNEAAGPARELGPLDPLRPITVSYGSMSPSDFDDESSNRELLDLEGGKNKQFVNMMSDNYFGDNIYADYFTPDRVEAFDDKGPTAFKDNSKEAFSCSIWGEPSSKDNEFVLPNFIHESYKIADNGEYADSGEGADGGDSKADVPPLNICADERMPPRGEISGQESNGDMESSWNGVSLLH